MAAAPKALDTYREWISSEVVEQAKLLKAENQSLQNLYNSMAAFGISVQGNTVYRRNMWLCDVEDGDELVFVLEDLERFPHEALGSVEFQLSRGRSFAGNLHPLMGTREEVVQMHANNRMHTYFSMRHADIELPQMFAGDGELEGATAQLESLTISSANFPSIMKLGGPGAERLAGMSKHNELLAQKLSQLTQLNQATNEVMRPLIRDLVSLSRRNKLYRSAKSLLDGIEVTFPEGSWQLKLSEGRQRKIGEQICWDVELPDRLGLLPTISVHRLRMKLGGLVSDPYDDFYSISAGRVVFDGMSMLVNFNNSVKLCFLLFGDGWDATGFDLNGMVQAFGGFQPFMVFLLAYLRGHPILIPFPDNIPEYNWSTLRVRLLFIRFDMDYVRETLDDLGIPSSTEMDVE